MRLHQLRRMMWQCQVKHFIGKNNHRRKMHGKYKQVGGITQSILTIFSSHESPPIIIIFLFCASAKSSK